MSARKPDAERVIPISGTIEQQLRDLMLVSLLPVFLASCPDLLDQGEREVRIEAALTAADEALVARRKRL